MRTFPLLLLLAACGDPKPMDGSADTAGDPSGDTADSADSADSDHTDSGDTDSADTSGDCNGGDPTTEVPYDGLDNDCDPSTPDDDLDGDGRVRADDCDDTDPAIGGAEVAYDGLDNDCDLDTPDDDLDGDGYDHLHDCDDTNTAIRPGAVERCDGIDNNCDTVVDGADAFDATTFYADLDGDTYGDPDNAAVSCDAPSGYVTDHTDCDDTQSAVNPAGREVCDSLDNDCDGSVDDGVCTSGGGGGGTTSGTASYGGHRIDKDGQYFYALYNDRGVGVLGASDWYGSSDSASAPEGVAWNDDQTVLYYNDLTGHVFAQTEPMTSASTLIGTFSLGQIGGGVYYAGTYIVGDYTGGNLYQMDLTTGATAPYADLGSTACKPYFGNSAMAVDSDGTVYASSSCGVVVYRPGSDAVMLNTWSNLISAVAMDASQELYAIDYSGNIYHFDKSTGAELGHITIAVSPSTTWTMAVDGNGDFVINYWGEQRLFSHVDGSTLTTWSAASYYPGSSGYYWYVTF